MDFNINLNLESGEKLFKTCFRHLGGGLLEPVAIVFEAMAKKKATEIGAQAEQNKAIKEEETRAKTLLKRLEMLQQNPVLEYLSQEYNELAKRGLVRNLLQETHRQQNIETIIGQASLALSEDAKISDEPVEEDWINDFFENCKDIGDADMQAIWGKILAGEVAQPGSYSRRTLATLKVMKSTDISLFEEFYIYVWGLDLRFKSVFNSPAGGVDMLATRGCLQSKRMHLEDIGLIRSGVRSSLGPDNSITIQYEKDFFKIANEKGGFVHITGDALTGVGAELSRLAKAKPDYSYRDEVLEMLAHQDLSVTHIKGPNPSA